MVKPMVWERCPGTGHPAVNAHHDYRSMCPVCTKYVRVRIGERVPPHDRVKPPEDYLGKST